MANAAQAPTYSVEDFAGDRAKECDLVMKGGVTSGVVYPYAILELAKAYRFRAIGGTSAGGIAAAFAAAAEYSRTVRGDPRGFLRMQTHCERLPEILGGLFQPDARFAPLMRFLLKAQGARQGWTVLWSVLTNFWLPALMGVVVGAAVMALLDAGWAGVVLGAVVGVVVALAITLARLALVHLPAAGFGLCSGLTQPGHSGPGLTDWLHAALQDIAFGASDHPTPLTFGDLAGPDPQQAAIDLRMMTTNLSMRRPHTLPAMKLATAYDPQAWARLFPAAVMDHLARTSGKSSIEGRRSLPQPRNLPVLVAVRMSLSFPLLFKAIPMWVQDRESARIAGLTGGDRTVYGRQVWFTDGGVSSNFPIHLFDALLPRRPTFALSLDDLPPGALARGPDGADTPRVFFARHAADGSGVTVHPIHGLADFASSILGAAKDWQDQLLSAMPGQRERIAHVYLDPKAEGGLNLTMSPELSQKLMGYGREVGQGFAGGAMNFDEHRWRRTLVVYEQLQTTLHGMYEAWNGGGYGAWFAAYAPKAETYRGSSLAERQAMHDRLGAVAAADAAFHPPTAQGRGGNKFPRPTGRLRIVPEA